MEKDAHHPAFGCYPPTRHELIGSLDCNRHNRCPAFQSQEKASPLERLDPSVPASCALGENEERIAPPLHQPDRSVNALLPSPHPFPVDRNKPHISHAHADDGNPEYFLLEDDADRLWNKPEKERPVEEAQVVGHEDIGSFSIQILPASNPDFEAEHAGAKVHSPLGNPEKRIADAERPEKDEQEKKEKGQDGINDQEKNRPHSQLNNYIISVTKK